MIVLFLTYTWIFMEKYNVYYLSKLRPSQWDLIGNILQRFTIDPTILRGRNPTKIIPPIRPYHRYQLNPPIIIQKFSYTLIFQYILTHPTTIKFGLFRE